MSAGEEGGINLRLTHLTYGPTGGNPWAQAYLKPEAPEGPRAHRLRWEVYADIAGRARWVLPETVTVEDVKKVVEEVGMAVGHRLERIEKAHNDAHAAIQQAIDNACHPTLDLEG